ncbi:MAG: hypothetical protein OXI51_05180 [Chloroflexota bacterium]|nr:hypothetical protein [Chloroflexota bacterium]
MPAAPGQTKGKVEWPIRYIRELPLRSGLRRRRPRQRLNDEVERWLTQVANVCRHETTGERPVDRFERDERGVPKPLARQPHRGTKAHRLADAVPQ